MYIGKSKMNCYIATDKNQLVFAFLFFYNLTYNYVAWIIGF